MRITKTTREYIENQVQKKLEYKYSTEKQIAAEQREVRDNLLNEAARQAELAYNAFLDENLPKYDFLVDNRTRYPYNGHSFRSIIIKDETQANSVHDWERRMRIEAKEIATQIVVTLELGGNKEDLERMLSEI